MRIAEFRARIEEYFRRCEEDGVFPDESGLILALGMTRRAYERQRNSTHPTRTAFRDALDGAAMRRESLLSRKAFAEGKTAFRALLDEMPSEKNETVELLLGGEAEFFD